MSSNKGSLTNSLWTPKQSKGSFSLVNSSSKITRERILPGGTFYLQAGLVSSPKVSLIGLTPPSQDSLLLVPSSHPLLFFLPLATNIILTNSTCPPPPSPGGCHIKKAQLTQRLHICLQRPVCFQFTLRSPGRKLFSFFSIVYLF